MKFRFADLTNLGNLSLQSNIEDKSIHDILNDKDYDLCALLVTQKQVEIFVAMLYESIYFIERISTWIKSGLTNSELFYASIVQKNPCNFVFWLKKSDVQYPKESIKNFYIERSSTSILWLNDVLDSMTKNNIEIDILPKKILVTNSMKKEELF